MQNLAKWLNELAMGVVEQAENLEAMNNCETITSLNLRDYFSQMSKVAELVSDDDKVDWAALANFYGDDLGLDLDLGYQVMMDGQNQGSPHTNLPEAEGHRNGLKRIPRDHEPEFKIEPLYLNKE